MRQVIDFLERHGVMASLGEGCYALAFDLPQSDEIPGYGRDRLFVTWDSDAGLTVDVSYAVDRQRRAGEHQNARGDQ
jgi:hypothetical protein